jgi:hypothetical protein
MSGAIATIAVGAAIGAAVGGISSAIQGGDIGMGILGGAVGGGFTAGIGGVLGGAAGSGLGGVMGGPLSGSLGGAIGTGVIAGAAGGALNSAITGGDPASGAVMGGAMGGFFGGMNYSGVPDASGAGAGPNATGEGINAGASGGNDMASGLAPLQQGPTASGATLDTTMLQTQGNSAGLGALSSPVTAEMLPPPGSTNIDPGQLQAAQTVLQTPGQGPSSPAFQQFSPDVKAAALQMTAGNAAPSATTMGAPSTGPMGGAYDSVNPLQRGVIDASNAANTGLYKLGAGGVPPSPTIGQQPMPYLDPNTGIWVQPTNTTPLSAADVAKAGTSAPWGNTGNKLVDSGLNWVQGNKGTAAMGGLGLMSMLGGSSSPAPATAGSASNAYNASPSWNAPLPVYASNRTVTAAPAGYRQGHSGEWMYFPAQGPTPVAAKEGGLIRGYAAGGKVAPGKGGLSSLGTGRRQIPGGQDDRVRAVLAQDEYVVPADVVAHLGDGSSNSGGARLDHMVKSVRSHKASNGNKFPPRARSPLAYAKG